MRLGCISEMGALPFLVPVARLILVMLSDNLEKPISLGLRKMTPSSEYRLEWFVGVRWLVLDVAVLIKSVQRKDRGVVLLGLSYLCLPV